MDQPRHIVLRDTLDHLAHHRGQLTVYLRLTDQTVPAIDNIGSCVDQLSSMRQMVDHSIDILRSSSASLTEFGARLHDAWQQKRTLSERVSTPMIDEIYCAARGACAIGGKLLGAGGGGFILIFAPPERQAWVREALKHWRARDIECKALV